jgi:hypothetical protein
MWGCSSSVHFEREGYWYESDRLVQLFAPQGSLHHSSGLPSHSHSAAVCAVGGTSSSVRASSVRASSVRASSVRASSVRASSVRASSVRASSVRAPLQYTISTSTCLVKRHVCLVDDAVQLFALWSFWYAWYLISTVPPLPFLLLRSPPDLTTVSPRHHASSAQLETLPPWLSPCTPLQRRFWSSAVCIYKPKPTAAPRELLAKLQRRLTLVACGCGSAAFIFIYTPYRISYILYSTQARSPAPMSIFHTQCSMSRTHPAVPDIPGPGIWHLGIWHPITPHNPIIYNIPQPHIAYSTYQVPDTDTRR